MLKFLIQVPHPEDKLGCARAIQVFMQSGVHYLTNAHYGCRDGQHYAWMIVDADSRDEATMIVPPAYRSDTLVVELSQFSTAEIEEVLNRHAD